MDKPRVAIYCRAANKNQAAINEQYRNLLEYAQKMGYDKTVAYFDNGVSGNDVDRPALKQLNADIADGTVSVVIIKDISRLGRNIAHCTNWFRQADKQGIIVLSKDNPCTKTFLCGNKNCTKNSQT